MCAMSRTELLLHFYCIVIVMVFFAVYYPHCVVEEYACRHILRDNSGLVQTSHFLYLCVPHAACPYHSLTL